MAASTPRASTPRASAPRASAPRAGTPQAEHPIDEALVRALLREQHPDLAGEPLRLVDAGWDNVLYRLGEHLVVRLPRRRVAVDLIRHEQRWLPELAEGLPIPMPTPLRIGKPGQGYPWPWSLVPWIPGRAADLEPPDPREAPRLADFLRTLHRPASTEAPANPLRGVPLVRRAEKVEERLERLAGIDDPQVSGVVGPEVVAAWRRALAAPVAGESLWLHGDLHARNVLVEQGTISGIIDWGDVTSGDPATDLASLWMLFADPEVRAQALEHYGADEALVARAKGWAIVFGVMLLDTGLVDHPRHAAMGRATLERLGTAP